MHIPDAYLSPATQAAAFTVMGPVWFVAARCTRKELTSKQAPLLSMGAAFCFAVQMFNIPAIGGTTAHALGAALLAILVGPWAAILGLTLTLTIQALLFGDGGILSLGANCFDMAVIAPLLSYGIYRLLSGASGVGSPRRIAAAGFGSYIGTIAASLSAGILLGIQPLIAHDALGHALYCPFGLNVSVPAMVMSHLLVAGPAEAIITVAALAYISHSFPEFLRSEGRAKIGQSLSLARGLLLVLALTPLGLLAGGTAWGEWGIKELKQMVGYAPAGVVRSHELLKPLFPDYSFGGISGRPWEIAGYLGSAVIGCTLVAVFARSLIRKPPPPQAPSFPAKAPSSLAPAWLCEPNPRFAAHGRPKRPWLERALLRMRSTVARTVSSELTASAAGTLQSIDPLAKTIAFVASLLAVALTRSAPTLGVVLIALVGAAAASKVRLKGFLLRVVGAVLFFGAVIAVPVSFQTLTPGPARFHVLGFALSATGLHSAGLILLRLAAGISLGMLWHFTTRWYDLLRTLRALAVPAMFITTATLTYRYLFVTIETLAEMVDARTSRQVGACDKRQARTYAGAGTAILFAKSLTFTEEMHWAMLSRNSEGNGATPLARKWTLLDAAMAIIGLALLTVVLIQRSHYAV